MGLFSISISYTSIVCSMLEFTNESCNGQCVSILTIKTLTVYYDECKYLKINVKNAHT